MDTSVTHPDKTRVPTPWRFDSFGRSSTGIQRMLDMSGVRGGGGEGGNSRGRFRGVGGAETPRSWECATGHDGHLPFPAGEALGLPKGGRSRLGGEGPPPVHRAGSHPRPRPAERFSARQVSTECPGLGLFTFMELAAEGKEHRSSTCCRSYESCARQAPVGPRKLGFEDWQLLKLVRKALAVSPAITRMQGRATSHSRLHPRWGTCCARRGVGPRPTGAGR